MDVTGLTQLYEKVPVYKYPGFGKYLSQYGAKYVKTMKNCQKWPWLTVPYWLLQIKLGKLAIALLSLLF